MDTSDIDLYLKAKRQWKLASAISWACAAIALISRVLMGLDYGLPYSKSVFFGSLLGLLLVKSDFVLSATSISRGRLLRVIESQFNRDPEAIRYLAECRNLSHAA